MMIFEASAVNGLAFAEAAGPAETG